MSNLQRHVFHASTRGLRCSIGFCANGCVNLHFGAVVVHLSTQDFLALEHAAAAVAAQLGGGASLQGPDPRCGGELH